MRERVGRTVPPRRLKTFDGRELTTYDGWCEAFDAFFDAREAWQEKHPGVELPESVVLGECPFEHQFPHSGLWERPTPDDGEGVRCREHGLRPDEH